MTAAINLLGVPLGYRQPQLMSYRIIVMEFFVATLRLFSFLLPRSWRNTRALITQRVHEQLDKVNTLLGRNKTAGSIERLYRRLCC